MKSFFTVFFVIIGLGVMQAQGISDLSLKRINDAARADDGVIDFDKPKTYIGTPYGNPEFQLGSISRNDSVLFKNIALRYNVISDQIEVKESLNLPNEEIRNLKKSYDLMVQIGTQKLEFVPYEGKISEGDYFEVFYEGRQIDMYKKHYKEVRYPIKASTSLTRDQPAMFTDKPTYFLVTKRKKFYQFPDSRKAKFKVFGNKAEILKKFARQNDLDVNKEEDLLKVVQHFESL